MTHQSSLHPHARSRSTSRTRARSRSDTPDRVVPNQAEEYMKVRLRTLSARY